MSSLVDELPLGTDGRLPRNGAILPPCGEPEIWAAEPSARSLRFPSRTPDWSDSYVRTIQPLVGLMLGLARRILGDEPQAWDAVQEALIALWGTGENPANLRAWLARAVTLRSLHIARSRARRQKHERRACQRKPEASTRDDPAGRIEHAEMNQILDEAFQVLPRVYFDVFMLRTAARMEYAEIADALNLPIGTVRSRLNRTRRMIQENLAQRIPFDG